MNIAISVFWRILSAFVLMSLSRLAFYIFNSNYFSADVGPAFLHGIRFDAIVLSWILAPFILISLIHIWFPKNKTLFTIEKAFYWLAIIPAVGANLIDIEYFKFTLKRTTADLLDLISYGNDLISILPAFIADFWYIIVLGIVFLLGLFVVVERIPNRFNAFSRPFNLKQNISASVLVVIGMGIGIRGGIQLVPLGVIDAGKVVQSRDIPLVLNTAFTFIKSIENPGLTEQQFFTKQKLATLVSHDHQAKGPFNPKNVVVLILESFSKEYIGFFNSDEGYTPQLDSLLKEGVTYKYSFANGRKSIDGVPAILASIPTLMETPFISSSYAANRFESLPAALSKYGYTTSFYHGGNNGTMGFNSFTNAAGISNYVGRNEYPNSDDYDGTWGIFDGPFMDFWLEELNAMSPPFQSTLFTLSSHHPYRVPGPFDDSLESGSHPIHKAVRYTDAVLGAFMRKASKTSWYSNTLFILTADHTSVQQSDRYNNAVGNFEIPICIIDGSGELKPTYDTNSIVQQIDIMPTILDYLGYPEPYFAFGTNMFANSSGGAVMYHHYKHQLVKYPWIYQTNKEEEYLFLHDRDFKMERNIAEQHPEQLKAMRMEMHAFWQDYNTRMIYNQLSH